jgi:hypothetical protein
MAGEGRSGCAQLKRRFTLGWIEWHSTNYTGAYFGIQDEGEITPKCAPALGTSKQRSRFAQLLRIRQEREDRYED